MKNHPWEFYLVEDRSLASDFDLGNVKETKTKQNNKKSLSIISICRFFLSFLTAKVGD